MVIKNYRFFTLLAWINLVLGILLAVSILLLWVAPGFDDLVERYLFTLESEFFWISVGGTTAFLVLLAIICYLESLYHRRYTRVWSRLYPALLGVSAPVVMIQASAYSDYLSSASVVIALWLVVLALPLSVWLIEELMGWATHGVAAQLLKWRWQLGAWLFLQPAQLLFPRRNLIRHLFGLLSYRRGRYAAAWDALLPLFNQGERSNELLLALAETGERLQRFSGLAPVLQVLREKFPQEQKWYPKLLRCYQQLEEEEKEIAMLEERYPPESLDLQVRLLQFYIKTGNEKATELIPMVFDREGEPYQQSLLFGREWLQKVPEDQEFRRRFAELLERAGKPAEAAQQLELLARVRSDDIELRRRILALHHETPHSERRLPHLEYLIDSGEAHADELFEYCEILFADKEYVRVAELAEEALHSFPLDYRFPYLKAQLLSQQGELEEAEKWVLSALALAPGEKKGTLQTFKVKIEDAMNRKKIQQLEHEIRQHPEELEFRFDYIEQLITSRQIEKAALELDKLLYENPELKPRVVERLHSLLEHTNRHFLLLNFLADVYLKDQQWEKTLDVYRIMAEESMHPLEVLEEGCGKILRLQPNFAPALKVCGDIARQREQLDQAFEFYRQYRAHAESVENELLCEMFQLASKLGHWEEARELAERLVNALPQEPKHYKDLARVLLRLQQHQEALNWLLKARELSFTDPDLFQLIRQVDSRLKQERLGGLREQLTSDPDNAQLNFELAELLLFFQRYKDAISYFQKALSDPTLSSVSKTKLAFCLGKSELFELAEETLREITVSSEQDAHIGQLKAYLYELGELFEREYRAQQALRAYKLLFHLDAGFRNVLEKIEHLTRGKKRASPYQTPEQSE